MKDNLKGWFEIPTAKKAHYYDEKGISLCKKHTNVGFSVDRIEINEDLECVKYIHFCKTCLRRKWGGEGKRLIFHAKFAFVPRDFWIGVYKPKNRPVVYICFIPMFPLIVTVYRGYK